VKSSVPEMRSMSSKEAVIALTEYTTLKGVRVGSLRVTTNLTGTPPSCPLKAVIRSCEPAVQTWRDNHRACSKCGWQRLCTVVGDARAS
jgi:hypothetical protein